MLAGATAAAAAGEEPTAAEKEHEGYVCSVTGRRGVRRLHFVGLCHRKPGYDFGMFNLLGSQMPGPEEYDEICKQCWPPEVQKTNEWKDDEGRLWHLGRVSRREQLDRVGMNSECESVTRGASQERESAKF